MLKVLEIIIIIVHQETAQLAWEIAWGIEYFIVIESGEECLIRRANIDHIVQ